MCGRVDDRPNDEKVEGDFPTLAQAVASRAQSIVLLSADLFPRTL